jgi:hypothetical protein
MPGVPIVASLRRQDKDVIGADYNSPAANPPLWVRTVRQALTGVAKSSMVLGLTGREKRIQVCLCVGLRLPFGVTWGVAALGDSPNAVKLQDRQQGDPASVNRALGQAPLAKGVRVADRGDPLDRGRSGCRISKMTPL